MPIIYPTSASTSSLPGNASPVSMTSAISTSFSSKSTSLASPSTTFDTQTSSSVSMSSSTSSTSTSSSSSSSSTSSSSSSSSSSSTSPATSSTSPSTSASTSRVTPEPPTTHNLSSITSIQPSTTLSQTSSHLPASSTSVSGPNSGTAIILSTIPTSSVATPSIVTSVVISTSGGQIITITEVSVNQTLSPNDNNTNENSFFKSTGAVAGVFVVVGLAAASILLWIFFAIRRRRRTRRLEHNTAVSATLAAAGFHRTPLEDDDGNLHSSRRSGLGSPEVEMHQQSNSGLTSSAPSAARTSAYIDSPPLGDTDVFNPYRDYAEPPNSTTPPGGCQTLVTFHNDLYQDRNVSGGGEHALGHSASHSVGSYEPLLASYPGITHTAPPSPPPRNPLRLSDASRAPHLFAFPITPSDPISDEAHAKSNTSSVYSSESVGDERLDPGLRQRMFTETVRASQRDLRDEEDYSRPVLGVRNLQDEISRES